MPNELLRPFLRPAAAAAALLLAGCASVGFEQTLGETNRATQAFTEGRLELSRTEAQRQARAQRVDQLLAEPLAQEGAVQLALANSPALQALLAQGWADLAQARQGGRIANPVFSFERMRLEGELELGRLLSIGLLDLLTLPRRQAIAGNQAEQVRTQLAATVVGQVTELRQAWVRAVAAQQMLAYAQQVSRSAQAGAELARRMQQVGNFSKLQRARQHVFYADAAARLAGASHEATAAREALVRQLGLDEAQAARLRLPERLPDVPAQARSPGDVNAASSQQRLDVQMARLQLAVAGQAQGLDLLNSLVDVELGVRHDTVFENAPGAAAHRANRRGFELAVRLPLFDWGDAQRAAMNAQSLAAAQRYDGVVRAASSELRESYSAYRTAHDLARHYRDEIVPLRQAMAEESVLRYNGMLIGVFELLADSREQIAAVTAAVQAQQQFWLAHAALSASLIGQPLRTAPSPAASSGASSSAAGAGH